MPEPLAIRRLRPLLDAEQQNAIRTHFQAQGLIESCKITDTNHVRDPGVFTQITCRIRYKDGSYEDILLHVDIRVHNDVPIGVIVDPV